MNTNQSTYIRGNCTNATNNQCIFYDKINTKHICFKAKNLHETIQDKGHDLERDER